MARVLVPLAEGCEELEAVTITDLLTRADIEVVTAGLKDGPVKASRGITLVPDTTLDAVMDQAFDMMVLPGGLPGADYLDADPRIHEMLKRLNQQGKFTAAICAAPKVLAGAGLLQGRRATSYPGVLDNMDLPQVDVQLERVISDDRVITSRGPGTAMDFALELIEQLSGRETRDQVEQGLVR
ncbi:MAG: DJ-1/PfpI family protein [Candidatus Thiodiazotropha sp. (ex Lucina aurantia)]|uniref:DJ-1/PfpI family protein n=1 Tax=Candidatus Thiodiazotropha taylori TaxID=2792791 RepID=A0A9E4NG17_9GAMM|nr:DJ-1 family glyoxalase III [Candidatus Thiodiazotropha endolucinida]MBT3010989.1 DJ-1/PfpI family protein [Candidatus Thiodiazotropha sp. (ex Lucina pensylvanica)]MBT3014645.1 DJ-1/PfpI family protein [Candidatus Thiodiazotropha taylori]MBT3037533.1 DJ-1/PfpI family protein [Candidatus Thiodiazotropha sp. (ex Codakia orbicularis)]MBV2101671.1 DJ-1/PfpI family protein [Candidatus Thiodiazotropha sp. (ex Lucina aurantia)]MBT3022620.1 DJ-1/PfpI family protein [Candidatus Thiodiazotropha taylor